MKKPVLTALCLVTFLFPVQSAGAQVAPDSAALRRDRALDSLSVVVETLKGQVEGLTQGAGAAQPRTPGAYMNISFVALTDFGWSTESDVRSLQLGDHDPRVRGFTIPNAELALNGIVDPYFQGFANVVYKLDENGETGVELEEMIVQTTSLPANLQVKVGQFFTEFGRQNQQHPHSWAFADQPLILNRLLGPEGLRGQSMRVSWLLPTPWYTEGLVTVMNSAGGTTFSFLSEDSREIHGGDVIDNRVEDAGDLLFASRLSTSFDLTDTQTLLMGGSAALGPNNSGADARTNIYGVDLYWKWKSPTAYQGFPFLSLQSEALFRRYEAARRGSIDDFEGLLPEETLQDRGIYSQLLWGIKPRVVAGLRGEIVDANEASFESELRTDRYRITPNFTWYPTEFSKLRIQYNLDHRQDIGLDHSVWMQLEVLLGAHAAHTF